MQTVLIVFFQLFKYMLPTDKFSEWADGHVFYNMYLHNPSQNSPKWLLEENAWRVRMSEALNGHLLTKNAFFDDIKNSEKIYLAHTTSSLDKVLETKSIFSSGGCLIGSIYCTPLSKEGDKFRMHNLGKYIVDTEAPIIYKNIDGKKIDTIIFEITLPDHTKNNLVGIDYLRLGEVHYSIYKELEYLLSSKERYDLHNIITNDVKNSIDFLSLCNNYYTSGNKVDKRIFFETFHNTVKFLPILGYLYFEAVSEYLMLYQDNEEAKKYAKLGEFYNPSYKDLMYSLQPLLKKNYKLSYFNPSIDDLASYIIERKIFSNFDLEQMTDYLSERLVFWVNTRLFNTDKKIVDWRKFRWDFDNLVENAKPLVGNLIHRELRNFGRYPSFYFYFDQTKALQIWNYWNHMDVIVPFNGVFPKGEIGINPAYPDLEYKVYVGKVFNENGLTYIKQENEIEVDIVPKLVDLRFTVMRNNTK